MNFALWGAVAFAIAAGVADWQRREVPHWTVVGIGCCWLFALPFAPETLGFDPWCGLLYGVGGLAIGLVCFGLGWLGAGDGKLLAVLGLWLGPEDSPFALLATAGIGLMLIVTARLAPRGDLRHRGIPLACAIVPPAGILLAARTFG